MEITKETVQDRIVELKKGLQEALANVNAITGALKDCEYWLYQMGKEAKKEEVKA